MLTYCRDTLIEELERCEYNRNFLLEHLDMLPHGTLKIKKKEGKEFLYYSYQKNKEKIEKYLGENTEENRKLFEEQNNRYKRSKKSIQNYKKLEKKLKKAIKILSWHFHNFFKQKKEK